MDIDDPDVFCGYQTDDIERVSALMQQSGPDPAFYIDAFGVKVDPSYCPWVRAGAVQTNAPFPSDDYLAEGIEYAAAAIALERAEGQSAFTSVELGAGWGPWTAFMGVEAKRLGFKTINLAAFEADAARFEFLKKHLSVNNITPSAYNLSLYCSAAWYRNKRLYWPADSEGGNDASMMAVPGLFAPRHDYKGQHKKFKTIEGRSISEALNVLPTIDFMHIDIQGSELELIVRSYSFLSARVRFMFVGTHSRKIEGDLIEFLDSRGWTLIREKPCRFDPSSIAPTLTGKTYRDGGQFWRNTRLLENR